MNTCISNGTVTVTGTVTMACTVTHSYKISLCNHESDEKIRDELQ